MSIISQDCAIAIQNNIFMLTLDDYTPHGILGGSNSVSDQRSWQYAVDIIYRCLAVGLWKVWNLEWLAIHGIEDYGAFCKRLSELSPYDLSEEGELFWLEPLICSTELGYNLVKKFNVSMASDSFCGPFIDEVEKIFSKRNISWGMGSVFNVKV